VNFKKAICFFGLWIIFGVMGCGKGSEIKITDDSSIYSSTLVSTALLKAGEENCKAGGVEIASGIDENDDGVLSLEEIDTKKIVCHGESGYDSLLAINDEPVGVNCVSGGKSISSGLDTDRNGVLNESEITTTDYICNGNNGIDGISPPTYVGEKITTSANCSASLSRFPGLSFYYYFNLYESNNVFVSGAIFGAGMEINSSLFYSSSQLGAEKGLLRIIYDVEGDNNYGTWSFEINPDTYTMTLMYEDKDLIDEKNEEGSIFWPITLESGLCKKYDYN